MKLASSIPYPIKETIKKKRQPSARQQAIALHRELQQLRKEFQLRVDREI